MGGFLSFEMLQRGPSFASVEGKDVHLFYTSPTSDLSEECVCVGAVLSLEPPYAIWYRYDGVW